MDAKLLIFSMKHLKKGKKIDDIEVVAKIIATKDDLNLKERIIFTTNNQNSINKDIQSLNEFLKKLEEYFNGFSKFELFFERLRGQYSNINPPYKRINIEDLARVYISIFFKEPHKMKSNAIKKINDYQKNKKIIFNSEDEPNKYFYCAILFYWLNHKIINQDLKLKSKTMDMHFLLACNLFLENKYGIQDVENKIEFVINEEKINNLFSEVNQFLEQQEYLFEKRGFYSAPKTKKLIEAMQDE